MKCSLKIILIIWILFWSAYAYAIDDCVNREQISSACLCNGSQFTSGYCCYNTVSNVVHQTSRCGYTEVSPHWNHVLISKDEYRYDQSNDELKWDADHFDLVDFDFDRNYIDTYKQYNPTAIYILYQLDQTIPMENKYLYLYNDLVTFASDHGYNVEDAFLHLSNDTTLTPFQDQGHPVSVTGCTQDTRNINCRLQTTQFGIKRWITNPKSQLTKDFYVSEWNKYVANGSQSVNRTSPYDGIFLDEHPLFPAILVNSNPPGQILEYDNKTWTYDWTQTCPNIATNSFEQSYYPDFANLLAVQLAGMGQGKKLIPNIAAYFDCTSGVGIDQANSSSGGFLEFTVLADRGKDSMVRLWNGAKSLTDAGKIAIFVTTQEGNYGNDYLPANYDQGSYGSATDRSRIVELAIYYLGKDAENKYAYFDVLGAWGSPYTYMWPAAAEVDIGKATGDRYSFQSGTDPSGRPYEIFARAFENGLVLFRPKDDSNSNYGDSTKVSVTLPETLIPINSSGESMGATTSFTLRNSEGVILVRDLSGSPEDTAKTKVSGGCSFSEKQNQGAFSLILTLIVISLFLMRRNANYKRNS
jgi:hypothetical protein